MSTRVFAEPSILCYDMCLKKAPGNATRLASPRISRCHRSKKTSNCCAFRPSAAGSSDGRQKQQSMHASSAEVPRISLFPFCTPFSYFRFLSAKRYTSSTRKKKKYSRSEFLTNPPKSWHFYNPCTQACIERSIIIRSVITDVRRDVHRSIVSRHAQ